MANETEFGNFALTTDVISAAISPALVSPVVVAPHIFYEALPVGTNVKLFRKDGSLVAETISETTAHTVDAAGQELTQSTVTATCVKLCSNCEISVEAEQWAGATYADIARYAGEAIARDWDDEILALFASFDNTVTCSSILTIGDCIQAAYNVRANTSGVSSSRLVGIFDFKGMMEIQKEIVASGASNYSLESEISLLQGIRGNNGFSGSKAGIDFYQTSGLPTSGSDDQALVYDPAICFAGMISDSPEVRIDWAGGIGGYMTEISAYIFCDIIEWNDAAGCEVASDT